MIKRWAPFVILITIAVISFLNLVFFTKASYKPETDDPDIIYYEACSDCHGETGKGSGILYPAFDSTISREEIQENIMNGGWLMPKFEHIHGDTLKKLVNYIYEQNYNEEN